MGSIFKSEHRRYVLIQEIPVQVLNAVVAAEDKNFYRHAGVDIIAIDSTMELDQDSENFSI